jgi:RNA polymerase sigma-70 factor, ECF subfamily
MDKENRMKLATASAQHLYDAEPQFAGQVEGEGDAPSDAELVDDLKTGSPAALTTLVRRYQKPLYFMCYRYVHDQDAAADLAQRAFMRVMERIGDLRDAEIFRSWLFAIGVNLARNHLRYHARFVASYDTDQAVAPEAFAHVELTERRKALRRAVATLPPRQRRVVELRVFDDLSFRDIARSTASTENAAKVNFHLAVKKLRALLQPCQ